jgi:hypothetical protein
MTAFRDIAPCSLNIDGSFSRPDDGGSTRLLNVYFNETTQRYIPEGCHLDASNLFVAKQAAIPNRTSWSSG